MCYFITMAVPKGQAEDIRKKYAESGLSLDPTSNPSAQQPAGPDFVPLLVTGGGCSCAWYVRPDCDTHDEEQRRRREKYRKLGWSDAKIERALATPPKTPPPDSGLHPTIRDLLKEVAAECGEVRVWVHDFTGRAESEPYTIRRTQSCALSEVDSHARELGLDNVLTILRDGVRANTPSG